MGYTKLQHDGVYIWTRDDLILETHKALSSTIPEIYKDEDLNCGKRHKSILREEMRKFNRETLKRAFLYVVACSWFLYLLLYALLYIE